MPLNAVGWLREEDFHLVDLVRPNTRLYDNSDPSRRSIVAREVTWQQIANTLGKPVEECKKRWRGLRDGYMRSVRMGSVHKSKEAITEKLQFLGQHAVEHKQETQNVMAEVELDDPCLVDNTMEAEAEQEVITDNQEYYEITIVDGNSQGNGKGQLYQILPQVKSNSVEPPRKSNKKNAGRKRSIPMPRYIPPVKILPKPIVLNGAKIQTFKEPKLEEARSSNTNVINQLVEKILKENTNEIDVFFRSMAASVKKLHPNLIPKVKMEVCNVIAKYEMQSIANYPQSKSKDT